MNCEETRRKLLAVERLDRTPAVLRPHLDECHSCRDWLHNVIELEARVSLLPVPSSGDAKERFLQEFREAPLVPQSLRVVVPELPFTPPKERGLRKLAVAIALAAAVVLFAVGLSVWPRHPAAVEVVDTRVTTEQVQSRLRQIRDERVAKARTPRDKANKLAEFADGLLRDIDIYDPNKLPAVEQLKMLAEVYEDTVRVELMAQARAIIPEEQRSFLPHLAQEFGRTESDFERLASLAPEASAIHLRQIAAVARDGGREMLEIARHAGA